MRSPGFLPDIREIATWTERKKSIRLKDLLTDAQRTDYHERGAENRPMNK